MVVTRELVHEGEDITIDTILGSLVNEWSCQFSQPNGDMAIGPLGTTYR